MTGSAIKPLPHTKAMPVLLYVGDMMVLKGPGLTTRLHQIHFVLPVAARQRFTKTCCELSIITRVFLRLYELVVRSCKINSFYAGGCANLDERKVDACLALHIMVSILLHAGNSIVGNSSALDRNSTLNPISDEAMQYQDRGNMLTIACKPCSTSEAMEVEPPRPLPPFGLALIPIFLLALVAVMIIGKNVV
ncbi:hypothetical protein F5146DRAFT_1005676 [Armillaria mellea]|nr:hypothetical protein F5146DRAFT_1005676 [Armillaria mellea]